MRLTSESSFSRRVFRLPTCGANIFVLTTFKPTESSYLRGHVYPHFYPCLSLFYLGVPTRYWDTCTGTWPGHVSHSSRHCWMRLVSQICKGDFMLQPNFGHIIEQVMSVNKFSWSRYLSNPGQNIRKLAGPISEISFQMSHFHEGDRLPLAKSKRLSRDSIPAKGQAFTCSNFLCLPKIGPQVPMLLTGRVA